MKKGILLSIIIALVFGVSGFFLGQELKPKEKCVNIEINNEDTKEDEPQEKNLINHTFTRTYHINYITDSNDYEYLYITIREFQNEEVETVKINKNEFDNIQVGDNWEITFKIINNDIEDNIKSIFKNCEIITAKKTDKIGLEQVSDPITE